MHGPIDPSRLKPTRDNRKRWLADWWELTRRGWPNVLCIALATIGVTEILSRLSSSYWMNRVCDLLACTSMAVLMLEYTRADHPASLKQLLSTLRAGLPAWLAIAGALYCALATVVLGAIALIILITTLGQMVFGPLAHNADPPPLPPDHVPPLSGIWHVIASTIDGGTVLGLASLPYSMILVASYVAYFIGCGLSMNIVLSLRFIGRNLTLVGSIVGAQVLALILGGLLSRSVPWNLLALPLTLGVLPFVSGMTYILARESFMGQGRNQPARARRRTTELAAAPARS